MKYSNREDMVGQLVESDQDIILLIDNVTGNAPGNWTIAGILDQILRGGFKGYNHMTDNELKKECKERFDD